MKPVAAPEGVAELFPPGVTDTLATYAGWLAGPGVERGLLGPRETPRLWQRHLLNSAAMLTELDAVAPAGSRVCDLGSGAGLPGLVVAICRPELDVVLLEPLQRRADFLAEVVADLGLPRVQVVRARAEGARLEPTDAVVARAVAPLDRLARWSLPLLRQGGWLLALKGERASTELRDAEPALRRLGAAAWSVSTVGFGSEQTWVVRLQRGRS